MTKEEIDSIVMDIMMYDGPDGHIDGHQTITDFILALLNENGEEWVREYLRGEHERSKE